MKLTDEELMAYADGALPEPEASRVKQAIESNPDLQARVDEFIQTRELLQQAYAEVVDEAIPERLLNTINQATPYNKNQDNVVILKQSNTSRYMQPIKPMAIAASIALVVGVLAGHLLSGNQRDHLHQLAQADAGFVVAGNPLHEALEKTPSHKLYHVDAGAGDIIVPIMSFKATDNRYCREFEINADSFTSMGVACRVDEQWQVEVLLAAERRPEGELAYRPATGYSEDALNAVLDKLWNGEAYDHEQESNLIANNWHN